MGGWGAKFESVITSFPGGVRTSARGENIPSDTSPQAVNGAWADIGDGTAIVEKRKGMTLKNPADRIAGGSFGTNILFQYFFNERLSTAESFKITHVMVGSDSQVYSFLPTGLVQVFTAQGNFGSLSTRRISAASAKNYAYLVSGGSATSRGVSCTGLRFDGENIYPFGIEAPATPAAVDTGAGVMNGTYDWKTTYYNSNTGWESSSSPFATNTPVNEQTQVTWVASADGQVTHVNVYVRKQSLGTGFYRATSKAIGTLSVTLNLSDANINALTIQAPDTDENDPPPSGTKYLSWHKSRMFAATDQAVYYSKVELPEYFDPEKYEPVNPDDGQKIRGIISMYDKLIVLKDRSVYALVGDGPNDWFIEKISSSIGCVAPNSLVVADGNLYWWSVDGPVMWNGIEPPVRLGKTLVDDTVNTAAINASQAFFIWAGVDPRAARVCFAVPSPGSTENDVVIPFNYQLGQFEGVWYGPHVASYATGTDASGLEWLYQGGYFGWIYKTNDGRKDGIEDAAKYTGTFTATTTSITTIVSTDFNTSTGYMGLYASIVDETAQTFVARRHISTSNSTTITFTTALTGLTIGNTYRWYLGGIDFQFDTKWQDDGAPFHKKRYEFVYLDTLVDSETTAYVDFETQYGGAGEGARTLALDLSVDASGLRVATWDVALWDESLWAEGIPVGNRMRAAKTGTNWRLRVVHADVEAGFKILKAGVRGEYLTTKR